MSASHQDLARATFSSAYVCTIVASSISLFLASTSACRLCVTSTIAMLVSQQARSRATAATSISRCPLKPHHLHPCRLHGHPRRLLGCRYASSATRYNTNSDASPAIFVSLFASNASLNVIALTMASCPSWL
jgi:hypothetical protein